MSESKSPENWLFLLNGGRVPFGFRYINPSYYRRDYLAAHEDLRSIFFHPKVRSALDPVLAEHGLELADVHK